MDYSKFSTEEIKHYLNNNRMITKQVLIQFIVNRNVVSAEYADNDIYTFKFTDGTVMTAMIE